PFNVSSCFVAQHACFFYFNNATNAEPNFSLLKDFAFFGQGWPLTGNFSGYSYVVANRVTSFNFWIWNLGGSGGFANQADHAITLVGPNYMHAFTVFRTGNSSACHVSGTGGTSAGLNQMSTMEQSYCKATTGHAILV